MTPNLKELLKWLKLVKADHQFEKNWFLIIKNVNSLVVRKGWFKVCLTGNVEYFEWDDNWELIYSEKELYIKFK